MSSNEECNCDQALDLKRQVSIHVKEGALLLKEVARLKNTIAMRENMCAGYREENTKLRATAIKHKSELATLALIESLLNE